MKFLKFLGNLHNGPVKAIIDRQSILDQTKCSCYINTNQSVVFII
jgi:hypothetical protein